MYDSMRNGIVAESSSYNFLLRRPNDILMLLCVCPTIKKDTNISLKIHYSTSNDQKQNTFVVFSTINNLNMESWRQGFCKYGFSKMFRQ